MHRFAARAKALVFAFLPLGLLIGSIGSSAPVTFDPFVPAEARARLLAIKNDSTLTEYRFSPPPEKGSPQEAFLAYFTSQILPRQNELTLLGRRYSTTKQLIESALYLDDEEALRLKDEVTQLLKRYSEITSDPEWEKMQIEFGRLAQGLGGEMAKMARINADQLKFNQFSPEMQPLLEESMRLEQEVDAIADESKLKEVAQSLEPVSSQVLIDYFAGKLSFEEAAHQLEKLSQDGNLAYGHDIATQGGQKMNRVAVLRSELAKSKGFATWADMQIASQSLSHAPGFQTKSELLNFLHGLLSATDPITREYNEFAAKKVTQIPYRDLRPSQTQLLGQPTNLLVRDYFPKEQFIEIWTRTMLESGFDPKIVKGIMVDAFPRPNKNGHAYMRPIQTPHVQLSTINGITLDPEVPEFQSPLWKPAAIYILQNFTNNGLPNLRTGFHEGGHGLDYSYQMDTIGYSSAYGYAETHSTTMEHFMVDREFLLANGKTAEGQPLSDDLVKTYQLRRSIQDLEGFRQNVANAILDIELWNYDYAQPGAETYVERTLRLAKEIDEAVSFIGEPKDLKYSPGFAHFVTSHYRGGSVTYFGYVLAEVSASMVSDALYEKLEALTGRRSLYNQPQLGPILVEGLYKRGFVDPFPRSIEAFTGKPFAPELFAQSLIEQVKRYLRERAGEPGCEALLLTAAPSPPPNDPQ